MLDVLDGQAEESLSQAAELFGGVGGEELQAGRGTALFRELIRIRSHLHRSVRRLFGIVLELTHHRVRPFEDEVPVLVRNAEHLDDDL